jgi:hypothetical protein
MLALRASDEALQDGCDGMTWAQPEYTREEYNRAAKVLLHAFNAAPTAAVDMPEVFRAFDIVNNWRAAHSYPLNAATMTLKNKSLRVYASALVSRRIKRLASIQVKLERYPEINLTRMQDIGGCRSIVRTVGQVHRLKRLYTKEPISEHIQRVDDYIAEPREDSGYRGVHLIYKYEGKKEPWEGFKIELQLRSRRMHAWATSVEIVDTFTRQSLKTGGGSDDWRRFFRLMATAVALSERSPGAPDTPRGAALKTELKALRASLRVWDVLSGYRVGLNVMAKPPKDAYWFVLVLDWNARKLQAFNYSRPQLAEAQARYQQIEGERRDGVDAVLVSVDQAKNLRRAYPNYYLDSSIFLDLVNDAVA